MVHDMLVNCKIIALDVSVLIVCIIDRLPRETAAT